MMMDVHRLHDNCDNSSGEAKKPFRAEKAHNLMAFEVITTCSVQILLETAAVVTDFVTISSFFLSVAMSLAKYL